MFNLIGFAEIDKSAIQVYNALLNATKCQNFGDIRNVTKSTVNTEIDLLCGGTPCNDFSAAGKQAGCTYTCTSCNHSYNPLQYSRRNRNNCQLCGKRVTSETQSALLLEYLRIVHDIKPKVFIWENVIAVAKYSKYKTTFNMFVNELQSYGYNTYIHHVNTTDYGIPQNRPRVFIIGILNIFDNQNVKLTNRGYRNISIADILQPTNEISDNLWLSAEANTDQDIINTIKNECTQRKVQKVFDNIGYIPTVFGLRNTADLQRFPCVTTNSNSPSGDGACIIKQNNRLRKITVQECFTLQGFTDEQFKIINSLNMSDRVLRRLSGNTITIDVLTALYRDLYATQPHLFSNNLKVLSTCSGIGAFELALQQFYNMYYKPTNITHTHAKYTIDNCLLQYNDTLSTTDICNILRCNNNTVHNILVRHNIPYTKHSNKVYVNKTDFIDYLNKAK